MKLLIFTQKVDKNDPTLGFFHTWIKELSKKSDSIAVVCLGKGQYDLPKNVTVYSLGKESGLSRLGYLKNLFHYLYLIRGSYDKVFVHMNEEYVLLCGLYWKIKNIPVYFWRNHPRGSLVTRVSVLLSKKVFCTSKDSFTARFRKTVIMPAGIDTTIFKPIEGVVRKKYSVCMVGRVSPIKNIDLALPAIRILVSWGFQVSLSIIGPIPKNDLKYLDSLRAYVKNYNLSNSISFLEAVSPLELAKVYSSYEVTLNLTDTGSFDKTIVEAAACGSIPLVSNKSFSLLLPEVCIIEKSQEAVSEGIKRLLSAHEQIEIQKNLETFVKAQSLTGLIDKLIVEMN